MDCNAGRLIRRVISLVAFLFPLSLLALSACGGGGGGGAFTPSPFPTPIGGGVSAVSTFSGTANPGADGTGAAARFQLPYNAVSDGIFLYVTDSGNHTVRRILLSNGAVSTLAGQVGVSGVADGLGTQATFNFPTGIAIDSTNTNLYVADTGNNMIRQVVIATGAVSAVAGSSVAGAADGTGQAAFFNSPHGIAGGTGSLYVADTGNNKIRRVDIGTGTVTSVTGQPRLIGSAGATDGNFFVATLNRPLGVTIIGTSLYVADTNNNKIRRVDLIGGTVSSITGVANTPGPVGALDAPAASAAFAAPAGIGTDGANTLYIADTNNNKIRQIDLAALGVSSLTGASSVSGTAGFADGAASSVMLFAPAGVTTAANAVIFVDTGNNTLRSFSLVTGQGTTLAGSALLNSGANGVGAAARYKFPRGIASDGANLYVADSGNHTIRKIVIATGLATTLAGQSGVAGAADGTGAAATFNSPAGIAADGGNLYVADTGNNKIRRVVIATGAVSSLTGMANTAVMAGAADGAATTAAFNGPSGIATDGGNLYVADTGNNKIRQVVIATGAVSSLTGAANTPVTPGATDGDSAATAFSGPFGIVIDSGKANLYVTDAGNNKIRQVVIATGAASSVTGAAGIAVTAGAADGAPLSASFNQPRGIGTDGTNLYVADAGNNKIRQVAIAAGAVSSFTGITSTQGAAGHADGARAEATFSGPYGIVAVGGVLYVADTGNSVIRRIQ